LYYWPVQGAEPVSLYARRDEAVRRLCLAVAAVVLVAALVPSAADLYARLTACPPTGLDEVQTRAERLGLCVLAHGIHNDEGQMLFISEEPADDWPVVRLTDPDRAVWRGRLLVTDYTDSGIVPIDPPSQAAWGDLHVFGDPRLIARIAAKRK
jgi:hypothetical protein